MDGKKIGLDIRNEKWELREWNIEIKEDWFSMS